MWLLSRKHLLHFNENNSGALPPHGPWRIIIVMIWELHVHTTYFPLVYTVPAE